MVRRAVFDPIDHKLLAEQRQRFDWRLLQYGHVFATTPVQPDRDPPRAVVESGEGADAAVSSFWKTVIRPLVSAMSRTITTPPTPATIFGDDLPSLPVPGASVAVLEVGVRGSRLRVRVFHGRPRRSV
ncbi:hypothetical protein [Rhodococcus sp. O3]|uniref:hypothetical protein n=1 Tax=Rhodococcus sp. O3 TaxID=3404919 RepID=UPI003B68542C